MNDQGLTQSDYEAIEQAMLATARGRWFLSEFARRNRNADTGRVLEEIQRLHAATLDINETSRVSILIRDMEDMRRAIEEARSEVAAIKPRDGLSAQFKTVEYDIGEIPAAVERATRDIVAAAERLRDIGTELKGHGVDEDVCDEIDTHACGIFMAASFQDMTGQRTSRLLGVLRYMEQRVDAVLVVAHATELAAAS